MREGLHVLANNVMPETLECLGYGLLVILIGHLYLIVGSHNCKKREKPESEAMQQASSSARVPEKADADHTPEVSRAHRLMELIAHLLLITAALLQLAAGLGEP